MLSGQRVSQHLSIEGNVKLSCIHVVHGTHYQRPFVTFQWQCLLSVANWKLNYSAESGVNQHVCDSCLLLESGKQSIVPNWTRMLLNICRFQRVIDGWPGHVDSPRTVTESHPGGRIALVRPGGEQLQALPVVADYAARADGSLQTEADRVL